MIGQICRHGAFYTVVFAIGFRLGWELSDRISSYAEELDPHVDGRW
ncbi:Uncharacterised protein [Mycobacteroides abscessus subsp. massiliense]|nr:Uncharacterised protein [Mycobacteroides abscessus subsp. massiliense]SKH85321.1 Uncharacterised protein [Mycobacteroides abscessus subsp. massiliense]SKK32688.1 Uncharacterised protein [Mycobacteroides abscessus subsp. massiliense]SKK47135.1 Uncharacterised protein [Mycobacteroides abscessus subsp. massiliense]SKL88358.1 Uncharacterised protein [Mycobacteroides abscessus subsp. massiliense]